MEIGCASPLNVSFCPPAKTLWLAGWVEVAGDVITAVGEGAPPRTADQTLTGALVPGYVDVHCHGGGGAAFATEDPADVETALAAHRSVGTTSVVASLITASVPVLQRQIAVLAECVGTGDLAGIHLEGPWLAHGFKGAHSPNLLADPVPDVVAALLAAAGGTIRMATTACRRSVTPPLTTPLPKRRSVLAQQGQPTSSTPCRHSDTAIPAQSWRSSMIPGSLSNSSSTASMSVPNWRPS